VRGPESDEDEVFEAYMRQNFPRALTDREPAPRGPSRGGWLGDQPTEDEQFEQYMRQHFE